MKHFRAGNAVMRERDKSRAWRGLTRLRLGAADERRVEIYRYRPVFMSSRAVKKQLNSLLADADKTSTQSIEAKRAIKKQRKENKKADLKAEQQNPKAARSKALKYFKRTAAPSDESIELMNKVAELGKRK
jgi:hypothetical protein